MLISCITAGLHRFEFRRLRLGPDQGTDVELQGVLTLRVYISRRLTTGQARITTLLGSVRHSPSWYGK